MLNLKRKLTVIFLAIIVAVFVNFLLFQEVEANPYMMMGGPQHYLGQQSYGYNPYVHPQSGLTWQNHQMAQVVAGGINWNGAKRIGSGFGAPIGIHAMNNEFNADMVLRAMSAY